MYICETWTLQRLINLFPMGLSDMRIEGSRLQNYISINGLHKQPLRCIVFRFNISLPGWSAGLLDS